MIIFITGGNGNIAKIIKKHLMNKYTIIAPSHQELDILNYDNVKEYINFNKPDIIIHTAIIGGRRTKEETSDVFYKNMIMFENLIKCSKIIKI